MVKTYVPDDDEIYSRKSIRKRTAEQTEEDTEEEKNYLDLWDVHPSFKDINSTRSITKTVFLLVLTFVVILSSYLIHHNLFISTLIGILFGIVFIVIFHDEFFLLQNLFRLPFSHKTLIDPFDHMVFWYDTDDPSTLYISNRNDLTNIALRVFKVEVVPENVHPTIKLFMKSLSTKNIRLPFSYQVVQTPVVNSTNQGSKRYISLRSTESFINSIYFTVFYPSTGIINEKKIEQMRFYIKKFSTILKSNIVANFHHFKTSILSDTDLINAIRTLFVKGTPSTATKVVDKRSTLNSNSSSVLRKFLFCIVAIVYFIYALLSLEIPLIYVIGINLVFMAIIFKIWWRSLFFQLTKNKLIHTENYAVVNPFENIHFYKIREFSHTLFLHIDNQLLIGMRMVNLKYIFNNPFCLLEKFFESLNNHRLSFSYTIKNKPIRYYDFYKHGLKKVHEKLQKQLRWEKIPNKAKAEEWLGYRLGMWYSILTLSVHSYKFISSLNREDFKEVNEELTYKADSLRSAFNLSFQNYEIEDLHSHRLLSGYLFTTLKNNHFRLDGTQLHELMVQGATLGPLTTFVDILKKGVETKIAAEFNTPLYLKNFITIGYTENTEVIENEVPVGFTLEQLKNLLIVNGTEDHRELVSMKIVAELMKVGVSCLVFDFRGTWSKLLNYFEGTQIYEKLLYFKLGSAFTTDPLRSDILYDNNNPEYLEYMFDAFGIAFKKDQKIIDMFRNTIKKNPDMDLKSIELDLQTLNDWQKSPINDSLLALFSDFTSQDLSLFQSISGNNKIHVHEFIQTNKTVIVDLSILRDLDKRLFFTFLIISKIIHSIKHSTEEIHKKIILIPNIDLFFNASFLDWKMNYGKINVFLDPLLDHNFGLIFSVNHIRYLHSHLFNYFHNIITFKATDKRDIATLKSQMSLQELYGTGYYSSKRNNTYQIEYLMNLKNKQIIVRREDINQPFPATVEWDSIKSTHVLPYNGIISFMEHQGYNLRHSERKILEQAKKTLFEKDLGNYAIYIDEIINFLDEVKNIDQVGNLYKQKIKTHLKEILYPRISKKTNKKEQIKKIRDEILKILLKQGYLVENHPKRASGSEALRTSYSVGNQYDRALDDYFKTKNMADSDIEIEVLEKETYKSEELPAIFQTLPRKYIIQKEKLEDAFAREFSELNYDIFKIYNFIKEGEPKKALKIEHGLIRKYLVDVYKQYNNVDKVLSRVEVERFLTSLGATEGFPFSEEELRKYIDKYETISFNDQKADVIAEVMYKNIYSFFNGIQNYLFNE